jgi:hypothetical protein
MPGRNFELTPQPDVAMAANTVHPANQSNDGHVTVHRHPASVSVDFH